MGGVRTLDLPIGAVDITLIIERTVFIAVFTEVIRKKYATPPTVCFTIWGTIFDSGKLYKQKYDLFLRIIDNYDFYLRLE